MSLAVVTKLAGVAGKVKFKAITKAPELWFIGGTIAGAAAIVATYHQTLKFQDILKEHNQLLEEQEMTAKKVESGEIKETYTPEQQKADRRGIYIKTGVKTVRTWAPVVLLGATSVICFGKSFGILKGRYFGAVAYAAGLAKDNEVLRDRIKERLGEEAYEKVVGPETKTVVDPETGEFKEQVDEDVKPHQWVHQKFFDETNPNWERNPEHNRFFLESKERWANHMLDRDGYLFLNDVYDMLELPKTQAGQIMGWRKYKDPEEAAYFGAANRVSFGLRQDCPENRRFINGYEHSILLTFNVDPEPIVGGAFREIR